jgi:hypothetical protein
LHLTVEDAKKYSKAYWDKMPKEVPHEYSREDGEPFLIDVDDDIYGKVAASEHGIMLWEFEYREIRKKGNSS